MALILNGDTGITFPVVAGGTSAVQASSGKVLQVVNATTATGTSTTTSTYITTTLSLSITPSSATSKILVFGQIFAVCSTGGTQPCITLFRGGSNLISQVCGFGNFYSTASGYTETVLPFSFLDSPASTSALTYAIYGMNNGGGTASFGNSARLSILTAQEISA